MSEGHGWSRQDWGIGDEKADAHQPDSRGR